MQWPQGDNMAASRPHNCIQSTDISFILSQTSVHGEVVLDRSDFVSKDNCPTNISEARGLCPPGPLPTVSSHFDPQWTDTSDLLLSKHTVILLLTLKKEKAFWKIFHYRKTMQSKVTQHKIEIFCITVRYDPEMMMDLRTENTFKNPVAFALTRTIITQFFFPLNMDSPPLWSLPHTHSPDWTELLILCL